MGPSPTPPPVAALLSTPLFAIHGTSFSWGEVLAQAEFLGLLETPIADLAEADAAAAAATATNRDLDPDDLHDALTQLRYHFNLITAEETEAWLHARYLTLDDLDTFLRGNLWRQLAPADADPEAWYRQQTPDLLARRLWIECHLRDLWPDLLPAILRRYLVEQLRLNEFTFDDSHLEDARRAFCRRHRRRPETLDAALGDRHFLRDGYRACLRREAIYLQYSNHLADPEACRRQLAARRPQLYQVDYTIGTFDDVEVAREAFLCVQVDGESLDDVCRRAGAACERATAYVEDLPETLARSLISAQPGELLQPPPLADGEGPCLIHLHRKQEPAADDPGVSRRLRQRIIATAFEPHVERDVSWPLWQLLPTTR